MITRTLGALACVIGTLKYERIHLNEISRETQMPHIFLPMLTVLMYEANDAIERSLSQ